MNKLYSKDWSNLYCQITWERNNCENSCSQHVANTGHCELVMPQQSKSASMNHCYGPPAAVRLPLAGQRRRRRPSGSHRGGAGAPPVCGGVAPQTHPDGAGWASPPPAPSGSWWCHPGSCWTSADWRGERRGGGEEERWEMRRGEGREMRREERDQERRGDKRDEERGERPTYIWPLNILYVSHGDLNHLQISKFYCAACLFSFVLTYSFFFL